MQGYIGEKNGGGGERNDELFVNLDTGGIWTNMVVLRLNKKFWKKKNNLNEGMIGIASERIPIWRVLDWYQR